MELRSPGDEAFGFQFLQRSQTVLRPEPDSAISVRFDVSHEGSREFSRSTKRHLSALQEVLSTLVSSEEWERYASLTEALTAGLGVLSDARKEVNVLLNPKVLTNTRIRGLSVGTRTAESRCKASSTNYKEPQET
jgi:hypothetical protein